MSDQNTKEIIRNVNNFTPSFFAILDKINLDWNFKKKKNQIGGEERIDHFLEIPLNSFSTCHYSMKIHSNVSLHLTTLSDIFLPLLMIIFEQS